MSTHKLFDFICVVVLLLTIAITVLFINGERLGIEVIVDEDAEGYSGSAFFTKNDLAGDWSTDGATVITLKGDNATVSGGGAYTYNGDVIITGAGRYVVSGTLTDGSVIVDAENSSKVWLLFDGVDITCSDDACLRVDNADKVFLTLAEGSENSLTSGETYSQTALDDGTDGAIFAHDDLTINGSGALTVTAGYQHGISANDDLIITGGTIAVTAPADGLRANEALHICNADIQIHAGDEGLAVNHLEGGLYIESGTLQIESGDDGIHTVGDILSVGGSLNITAADDGIHADTDFVMNGGSITLTAADDGIHADNAFVLTDGSIDIQDCYEGIEAVTIDIYGGDLQVHASDDGLNANGNSSGFGLGGFGGFAPEEQNTETGTEETWIHISGGSVTVTNDTGTDSDGLDSNGDIVISGGTVRVSLVNSGSNSALDYGSESGGSMTVSGGTVVACGSYSMAEGFDASSTQCSILYNISSGAAAGTVISLEDSQGNVLLSYEAPNSFSSVTLSTPEMKLGESYLVVIGDKVEQITLSEVSASYGDAASGGFGGNMNWGGMQHRDDFQGFENADGTMSEPPERPEGEEGGGGFGGNGERPQRPDASGEMPTPPEEMKEGAEPPAMPEDGAVPEGGSMQPMGGQPGGRREQAQQTTQEIAQGESAAEETESSITGQTWLLVALSCAALLAGLILAIKYRPE